MQRPEMTRPKPSCHAHGGAIHTRNGTCEWFAVTIKPVYRVKTRTAKWMVRPMDSPRRGIAIVSAAAG